VRNTRAVARLLAAIVCVVAVAACTGPGPGGPRTTTSKPPVTRPPDTVLLNYTATGGNCPEGLCGARVTISRNGAYHAVNGTRQADGQLDAATLRTLTGRIESEIGSLANLEPAPALCPSAYDGSDITITFHVRPAPVSVTNCDQTDHSKNREIPGTNPLLVYTTRLVSSLLTIPPATDKLLVEYHESGGHCRETCPEVRATITTNGGWTATSGPTSTSGTLDTRATADLSQRIRTQVGSLASLPPSTGCPSHYDGRDIEISFHVDGRVVTVSNCTKTLDGNPLLDHTRELIAGFI
jgi:hypothetical protein